MIFNLIAPFNTPEGLGIWIAAFLTLCIFSFLYKDNPFYKFAEHLFVGVSTGYYISIYYWNTLKPNLIDELRKGFSALGEGNVQKAFGLDENGSIIAEPHLRMIVPLMLGIFIFLIFISRKNAWLSRISFAWYIGVASGIAIPASMATRVLIQAQGSVRDFCIFNASCANAAGLDPQTATTSLWINSALLLIGTLCAVAYFFFSLPSKGVLKAMNKVGIYFLMISFGASFGYTVMARISLLIGRFQFLFYDWLGINI